MRVDRGPTSDPQTLEDVLIAGYDVVEIIVQDEYTHDVVTRRGSADFTVFDTT